MPNLKQCSIQKVILLRLAPTIYQKNNHPVSYRPPYTLKYIEALLIERRGYSIEFIDQYINRMSLKCIEKKIREYQPDVVIFDVTTLNMGACGAFCEAIHANNHDHKIVTICTGQEVSADVMKFRTRYSQYDICLGGEVELEVVSILKNIKQKQSVEKIKEDYAEKSLENKVWTIKDIDNLPFLHYDETALNGYNFVYPLRIAKRLKWGHMITSRGCPHPCIFCSQLMRESFSTSMRYRNAVSVVNEMEHLLEIGANIIAFDDEDFTTSAKHVRVVCNEIIRRKLKVNWIIHGRIDELDKSLLKLLSESGCVLLRVGIESGNRRILTLLEKTRKVDVWHTKSEEIVKMAQSYGISVACLFMVGSPTETMEEVKQSIDFAKKVSPDIIQVAYFTPFPGTRAYEMYKSQLAGFNIEDFYHYSTPKFNLTGMSDHELKNAQNLFYRSFLLRPSFMIKHFLNNLLFYLANYNVFLRLLKSLRRF